MRNDSIVADIQIPTVADRSHQSTTFWSQSYCTSFGVLELLKQCRSDHAFVRILFWGVAFLIMIISHIPIPSTTERWRIPGSPQLPRRYWSHWALKSSTGEAPFCRSRWTRCRSKQYPNRWRLEKNPTPGFVRNDFNLNLKYKKIVATWLMCFLFIDICSQAVVYLHVWLLQLSL